MNTLPPLDYSRYLIHTLFFLLEPGLFSEVVEYVDISSIPSVLARIGNQYMNDERICFDISTIISTISQSMLLRRVFGVDRVEKSVDFLLKGDVIEYLAKVLTCHRQNYLLEGYTIYSLYQLAQRGSFLSFCYSIIRSFNHSIIRSFNHSIIQSFNHSFIQSFNQLFIQSFIQSFI